MNGVRLYVRLRVFLHAQASTVVHLCVHARVRYVCMEGVVVVLGSKSAVIQALLSFLNDDVNL